MADKPADALKKLLDSDNFQVRFAAAVALKDLGDTAGQTTMESDKESDDVAQKAQAEWASTKISGAN